MGDVGFEEGFSDGMEAETFVEGDSRDLGVETDSLCALSFCFSEDGVHETGAKALMADGGKHATDKEDGIVGFETRFFFIEDRFHLLAEESGIGNDYRSAREEDMRRYIIDVIFIEINDTLFLGEDGIAGFEDLV